MAKIIPVQFAVEKPETVEFTPQQLDELRLKRDIDRMVRGEIAPRSGMGCALAQVEGSVARTRTRTKDE
jgi:hypothetical protein